MSKGGKRIGAGRPKTDKKTYPVRCHPKVIDKVREFAKTESEKIINSKKE